LKIESGASDETIDAGLATLKERYTEE